jgi:glycosyltransferase involved in cell wall biosynthesis
LKEETKLVKVSVIVSTYNWPNALDAVLHTLSQQTYLEFEIIIADDGSRIDTQRVIERWQRQLKQPIWHVFQEDKGFRAARIRNKAISKSQAEYIIFLDGDCLIQQDFVEKHIRLAEPGYFVPGNRILCQPSFSKRLLTDRPNINHTCYWLHKRLFAKINRTLPLYTLPSGARWRKWNKYQWKHAKTCNLGIWRKDLFTVNGFDEKFIGWGYEDSDLIIRLIRANVLHKSGRFYLPVFHLWHPTQDRGNEQKNRTHLEEILHNSRVLSRKGLSS